MNIFEYVCTWTADFNLLNLRKVRNYVRVYVYTLVHNEYQLRKWAKCGALS